MKGKIFSVMVAVLALFSFPLSRLPAHADIQPVMTLDNVFTALNAGSVDGAVASFDPQATVVDSLQGKEYIGVSRITQVLQGMQRDGRQYSIVHLEMDGNTVIAKVDVSDSGIVWGEEPIVAQVRDGKIQNFEKAAFRLQLWGY